MTRWGQGLAVAFGALLLAACSSSPPVAGASARPSLLASPPRTDPTPAPSTAPVASPPGGAAEPVASPPAQASPPAASPPPAVVVQPVSPAPAPASPAPAGTAAAEGATPNPIWLLLGLVAVLAAVLIGALVRSRRRGNPEWQQQADKAAGRAEWLAGSLVPSLLKVPTADEFEQLWFSSRPDAVETERSLFELTRDAPDNPHRDYASGLHGAVKDLIEALDAERRLPADDAAALRAQQARVEVRREEVERAVHAPVGARAGSS